LQPSHLICTAVVEIVGTLLKNPKIQHVNVPKSCFSIEAKSRDFMKHGLVLLQAPFQAGMFANH